jgi:hypothetical protein
VLALVIIVSSRTEVLPGGYFSISLRTDTAYTLALDPRLEYIEGDGVIQGGVLVFAGGENTQYATFRVREGSAPGDIIYPGGVVVRICCVEAPAPVDGTRRVYLPALWR